MGMFFGLDNSHPGQFLAIGWSDGFVRLMGLENNKAAHHIEVLEPSNGAKIAYIGWSSNRIATQSSLNLSSILQDGSQEGLDASGGIHTMVDLPRELTFLEIETALPKISPLPSSSAGTGYVLSFIDIMAENMNQKGWLMGL